MDIYFKCIHCDQRLVVDAEGIGLGVPCPGCGREVIIPAHSTVPPDEQVPPAAEEKTAATPTPAAQETLTAESRADEFLAHEEPVAVTPSEAPLAKPAVPPLVEPAAPKMPEVETAPQPLPVLRAPTAPPRVPPPPAPPPPPRVPKPAPIIPPASEAPAPPPKLHAPVPPPRVRPPLSHLPGPRAFAAAPALTLDWIQLLAPPPPPRAAAPPPPPGPLLPPATPPPPVPALPAEMTALASAMSVPAAPPVPAPVALQPVEPPAASSPSPEAIAPPSPPTPPPPPMPVEPVMPPAVAPALAPAARKTPAPSGIVPALDFDFPTITPVVSEPGAVPAVPGGAVKLPSILELEPLHPSVPAATPEPLSAPAPPSPPPPAAPLPVAPRAVVRLVEAGGPVKPLHEQWRELAQALAKQLWSGKTVTPPRATVIEAFLYAMPTLLSGGTGDPESAAADIRPDEAATRWREPFPGAGTNHVLRFERPDFDGIAERVAEMIERWLLYQDGLARQPGADAENISFSMIPERHSAVVSFGMNYTQRDTGRRKRVACWIARVGENRFLFAGKIPAALAADMPGLTPALRQAEAGAEPAIPLPRETILALPPPPSVDAETALTMRRLIIRFCEAHFVRYDNRLAAEIYDQIRRRRDVARAVLPDVLRVMPPSREKRMLQQVHREM